MRDSPFCSVGIALYSWITLPITSMNVILTPLCPIPLHWSLNFLINYVGAVNIYLYIIGAVRSFSLVRLGYVQFTLRILGTLATIPFVVVCEITAVLWGLFSDKGKFYVVEKRLKPPEHVWDSHLFVPLFSPSRISLAIHLQSSGLSRQIDVFPLLSLFLWILMFMLFLICTFPSSLSFCLSDDVLCGFIY